MVGFSVPQSTILCYFRDKNVYMSLRAKELFSSDFDSFFCLNFIFDSRFVVATHFALASEGQYFEAKLPRYLSVVF